MPNRAYFDAISAAREELLIEQVTTSGQLDEVQRLRYRIYWEERGFEPGTDGREYDEFDGHAKHVLVRSCVTGATLGTVRIVLPTPTQHQTDFPMNRVCEPYVLAPLPIQATGEISRFALTRDRQGVSPAASALMRIALMRGLVQASGVAELTHWCAIMECSLLRLLRGTAIHFQAVGPTVEYHGRRQPAVGAISSILGRMRREQPLAWSYVTDDGNFWAESAMPEALAAS